MEVASGRLPRGLSYVNVDESRSQLGGGTRSHGAGDASGANSESRFASHELLDLRAFEHHSFLEGRCGTPGLWLVITPSRVAVRDQCSSLPFHHVPLAAEGFLFAPARASLRAARNWRMPALAADVPATTLRRLLDSVS